MKQKRTFIAVLLVIAVLALGVAFAAQSLEFNITGKAGATASTDNFKVAFETPVQGEDVALEDKANDGQTVAVSALTAADQAASFTVSGMSAKGDSATVTFTVKNSSETLAAIVNNLDFTDVDDKFTCTAKFAGDNVTTTTLQPNGTVDVIVTVTLDETVTDTIATADVITVSFDATATQPSA